MRATKALGNLTPAQFLTRQPLRRSHSSPSRPRQAPPRWRGLPRPDAYAYAYAEAAAGSGKNSPHPLRGVGYP